MGVGLSFWLGSSLDDMPSGIVKLLSIFKYTYRHPILLTRDYLYFDKKKNNPHQVVLHFAWQRPTLTGGQPPTTIGAEKLNFRVR
ncbi:hypothetical protein ACFQZ9_29170, partial [Neobacillus sp. GCM10027624]